MILVLNCGSQSIKWKVFDQKLKVAREGKCAVLTQEKFQELLEEELKQIKDLKIDDVKYQYSVSLKLTGTISSSISLPAEKAAIENFIKKENFSNSEAKLIIMLDEEAIENKYKIMITNH